MNQKSLSSNCPQWTGGILDVRNKTANEMRLNTNNMRHEGSNNRYTVALMKTAKLYTSKLSLIQFIG